MRIKFSLVLLLFLSACRSGYELHFTQQVENTSYCQYSDSGIVASAAPITIDPLNIERLGSLSIGAINYTRHLKLRLPLIQDSLYNQMAPAILNDFSSQKFPHSRTWLKEKRSAPFVLQAKKSKFKICSIHAFDLDLLDLAMSSGFYYDKKNNTSPLNLYKGQKPKKSDLNNEAESKTPEPLFPISEEELQRRLIDKLSGSNSGKDLFSKKYEVIGLALKLDPSSLDSEKRPKLFVVLIFGGKKVQNIKVPEEMTESIEEKKKKNDQQD